MAKREAVQESPLVVFLCPTVVNYGLSAEDALKELNIRISLIKGDSSEASKNKKNLVPIERVLYGTQLIGFPGHGILKMAQILPSRVYKPYLAAEISKHSRIYVEVVENGFYIFMVCDNSDKNLDDIIRLI